MSKLKNDVQKQLKYYVYVLVNPDDNKIFYVGKGKHDRIFQHTKEVERIKELDTDSLSEKQKKIYDIIHKEKQPLMYIIRYNLDEHEAFLIESVLIELLNDKRFNLPQHKNDEVVAELLTNIQGGHSLDKGNIDEVESLNLKLGSEELRRDSTTHQAIVGDENINLLVAKLPSWRGIIGDDSQRENRTRGDWKLSKVRIQRLMDKGSLYLAAAEDGIITAVYKINGESDEEGIGEGRIRFIVEQFDDDNPILKELKGKNVFFNKSQFPIIYCCK